MTSEEKAADTAERFKTDTQGYKRRSMWFEQDQWDRMGRAAKKDGRSISGWLRALVDRTVKKG